jgi:hypothetical protein
MAGKSDVGEFRNLLAIGGLPELGPGPRKDVLPHDQLDQPLEKLLAHTALSSTARDLVRALVLLWHDRLDPAHAIAQGIEDVNGSFLHGIVHRREPDYGNARYWFRRVGAHGAFPEIARQAAALLETRRNPTLRAKLIPDGEWDPFAFIDLCENAGNRPAADPQVELLREIQAIESHALLDHFLNS